MSNKLKNFDRDKSPNVNEFDSRPKIGMPPKMSDYKLEESLK